MIRTWRSFRDRGSANDSRQLRPPSSPGVCCSWTFRQCTGCEGDAASAEWGDEVRERCAISDMGYVMCDVRCAMCDVRWEKPNPIRSASGISHHISHIAHLATPLLHYSTTP